MTYYRLPLPSAFAPLGLRLDVPRLMDDLLASPAPREAAWEPAAEAREDATGYTLTVDVPGVAPDGVELVAEEGTLLVRGARAGEPLREGERAVLAERRVDRFARRFRLPKHADLQGVTASVQHGVLTIRVPKTLPAQPRRIVVQGPVTEGEAAPASTATA